MSDQQENARGQFTEFRQIITNLHGRRETLVQRDLLQFARLFREYGAITENGFAAIDATRRTVLLQIVRVLRDKADGNLG